LSPAQKEDLAQWVRNGPDPTTDGVVRWRRVDLNRRIEERFGVVMHERTVGKQMASLGFRRLSVRPQHPKSNPEAQDTFEKTSRQAAHDRDEVWFQDEARVGQQGALTRIQADLRANRGTHPRAPRDTRY